MKTAFIVIFLFVLSCFAKEPGSAQAKKGKALYQATCTACHNADPKKAGAIGPEIYGSRLDVMIEKVKKNAYPKGYKPKRPTTIMIPLPHLTDADIAAIHAYLNGK
ncbi:MAG: cytochrome c [Deltaproteobacteria bacterium]